MKCKAKTKAGKRCQANALHGRETCLSHSDRQTQKSVDFGNGPRTGRPPNPKPVEVLRQKVEGEIEEWLAPLVEARGATRHVVVGNGPTAHVEEVPDIPTRIAAVREVLDRIYGRPKQSTELSGPDGTPLRMEVMGLDAFRDERTRKAGHEFRRRVAASRAVEPRRARTRNR